MKIHDDVGCSFCDKYFDSTEDLKHHVEMHTKDINKKDEEDKSKPVTKELKPNKHLCSKCSKEFTSRVEFDDHMKAHREILHQDKFAGKSILFSCGSRNLVQNRATYYIPALDIF
jgi:DNA-directed RNA polymerase subunit RPC12/RpoP